LAGARSGLGHPAVAALPLLARCSGGGRQRYAEGRQIL
jgi:hypothetical protein